MRNHSRWIILFPVFIIISCGGGGGGGGDGIGTPPPLYDGLTSPAVVSINNAMAFVNLMFGATLSPPDVGPGPAPATQVLAVARQQANNELPVAGVTRVPVSGTVIGQVSGTLTYSGNINYDYTGTLTFLFVNFNDGDGFTFDGKLIMSILTVDDFNQEITHAVITLWSLTTQSATEHLTLSGTIDSTFDVLTTTFADRYSVDGIDLQTGDTFRYANMVFTSTCDAPYVPSFCSQEVSGRVYLETDGYLAVSLQAPLEYHYMGQFNVDIPDTGGPLLMTGDQQTGIRLVPLNIMDVQVEIDIDTDPDYEYSQPYTWFDLVGLVITFEETYGDPVNFDVALAAIPTADKGFVAVGWTNTNTANGVDFKFIKVNAAGDQYLSKTYGGTDNEYAMAVRQTDDNGYIIAGYSESNYGLVYKVDGVGNELWSRTLPSDQENRVYDILATSDGGYLLAGYRYAPAGENYTGQDFYLVKLDADGNIVWEKVYGDIYADIGYSVIEVSTGGYLITGTSEMDPGTSGLDVLLVRTDTDGNLLWQSYVGGSYDQYGYDVMEDAAGNFVVAGITYDMTSSYGYSYALFKFDSSGLELWMTTFGTTSMYTTRTSVALAADGSYEFVGTANFDVDLFNFQPDSSNAKQVSYNWSMYTTTCTGTSIEPTWDGGYIIGGSAWPGTGKDFYLIKTDAQGYVTAPY